MCDLSREEVDAIAVHEHLPQVIAAELGIYLVNTAAGQRAIKDIIRDDILGSQALGDFRQYAKLKLVLCHLIERCRSEPDLDCCQ
jgi:hypothetical protein